MASAKLLLPPGPSRLVDRVIARGHEHPTEKGTIRHSNVIGGLNNLDAPWLGGISSNDFQVMLGLSHDRREETLSIVRGRFRAWPSPLHQSGTTDHRGISDFSRIENVLTVIEFRPKVRSGKTITERCEKLRSRCIWSPRMSMDDS